MTQIDTMPFRHRTPNTMGSDTDSGSDDYTLFTPGEGRRHQEGVGWLAGGAFVGLGGLAYMARNFKNRGTTKVSVYLIHTRLLVQGSVIAMLTGGMVAQMVTKMRKG